MMWPPIKLLFFLLASVVGQWDFEETDMTQYSVLVFFQTPFLLWCVTVGGLEPGVSPWQVENLPQHRHCLQITNTKVRNQFSD